MPFLYNFTEKRMSFLTPKLLTRGDNVLQLPKTIPSEGYIVDTNGKVCKEIHQGDKVHIVRNSQVEHLQEYMKVNKNYTFCKIFCKASDILAQLHLTPSEYQIIFAMLSHIGFGEYSGYLISIKCNTFNGYLNEEELRQIVNMPKKTFSRAIKELEKKEIIILEKNRQGKGNAILVNPFIFMKTNEITRLQYEKFKNSKYNFWNK